MRLGSIAATVAAVIALTVTVGQAYQKSPGAAATSAPASASTASASANTSGAPPGQSSANGTTVGSLSIESTILAYESMKRSADSIAGAVEVAFANTNNAKLIVATANDTSAILELRGLIEQARELNYRVDQLTHSLQHLACMPPVSPKTIPERQTAAGVPYPAPLISDLSLNPVGALFSTPADISAMIQNVASISATQESLTTASGNLGDVALMHFLAGDLAGAGHVDIFIPSEVPSDLAGSTGQGPNLLGTYIHAALNNLEWSRNNLELMENRVIARSACKSDPNFSQSQVLVATATAAVDQFENAIFGTSAATTPPSVSGSPAPAPSSSPPLTSLPSSNGAPRSVLSDVLYVDLLLHRVIADAKSLQDIYLLSVHALESGGSQLTKQQIFLGTRQFYSGGAITTFALFRNNGSLLCGGLMFGYRGFIRADDFSHGIMPLSNATINGQHLPDANSADPPQCPPIVDPAAASSSVKSSGKR